MNVFSINPGSSSLKCALYQFTQGDEPLLLARGKVEGLGKPDARLVLGGPASEETTHSLGQVDLSKAIHEVFEAAKRFGAVDAVGCRVVHGGNHHDKPVLVTREVVESIRAVAPLAPLHNAADLEAIQSARRAAPSIPVVAVFDTAFHRTMPLIARQYALPVELAQRYQIQRYGFHGISYKFVLGRLMATVGEEFARSLIICHLGNGASICAIRDGLSIDTSMGMTPLEGLVMGTRSGDLDPGIVLFLQQEVGMAATEIQDMLNHKSGLEGLSGAGGDVRDLEQAAKEGNAQAEFALDLFAYRVAKYIGGYTAALDGVRALAFTGGIGENSADMRSRICRRLSSLGIALDEKRNLHGLGGSECAQIDAGRRVPIWIVATNEELQIAKETRAIADPPQSNLASDGPRATARK